MNPTVIHCTSESNGIRLLTPTRLAAHMNVSAVFSHNDLRCGAPQSKAKPRVMATASSMPALKDNDTNLRSSLGTSVHSGGRLPVRVHPCMHSTSVLGVALTRLLGPLQVS